MLERSVPAPSKGALRALRQAVLYSGAGVAAGAAVLLAEERRRRICTARKIVDNARKLRASERYVHAMAVAARDLEGVEDAGIPAIYASEYGREALRHPLSSSEIDKAYERATTRPTKDRRRQPKRREHEDNDVSRIRTRSQDIQTGDAFGDQPLLESRKCRAFVSEPPPTIRRLLVKPTPASTSALTPPQVPQVASSILDAIRAGRAGCALQRFSAFCRSDTRYAEISTPEADRELWLNARKDLSQENINQVVEKFFGLFAVSNEGPSRPPLEIAWVLLELAAGTCATALSKLSEPFKALFNCIHSLGGITYSCLSTVHTAILKLIETCQYGDAIDLFLATIGQSILKDAVDRGSHIEALTVTIQKDIFKAAVHSCSLARSRSFARKINNWLRTIPNNQVHVRTWIDCVLDKCENHLEESNVAQATRTLISALQPRKNDVSKTPSLEMAHKLSDAAARLHLVEPTRQILSWLHAQHRMDPVCALNVIKACHVCDESTGLNERHEIIVNLVTRYRDQMYIPETYRPDVCTAFAHFGPFEESTKMITTLTNASVGSKVFEACQASYAILLNRVWSQTRNLEAVQSVFQAMLSALNDQAVPIDAYNALILARISAGQGFPADPEIFGSMAGKKMKPDMATFSHLMLSRAYADDWAAVRKILKTVHETGMVKSFARMSRFFNPMFRRFCRRHDSEEIRRFLQEAIDNYGIRPTQRTADLVLKSLVREKRLDEIQPWIDSMRAQGFNRTVNAHSAFHMLKRYSLDNRPSHQFLTGLVKQLDGAADRSLASKELYTVVGGSLAFDLSKAGPKTRRVLEPIIRRRLGGLTRKVARAPAIINKAYVDKRQTESQMLLALAWDKPEEAMKLYQKTLRGGLPASIQALEIAMEAGHRTGDESLREAYEELSKTKAAGMNVLPSLGAFLLHRMYNRRLDDHEIEKIVMDFYRSMADNGFEVQHYIAISGANYLVNKGRPSSAINLLTSIYKSEWAQRKPFDIVGMTVFLRAYAAARNLNGVQWVLQTVFSKNMRIDRKFHQTLRMAKKPFLHGAEGSSSGMKL
ncbi:hypothetical protein H2199_006527 [Coniosporium tulheliwenetii]|uniref:Uncharacterized protein n=1 Tax=Coniosporium tulheliwenetii TaxID=3383036 RepID=A0ACC2YVR5_9PEZI|nr:hypothetical protein H2199_006527 [Cladosporium sp. JES 115]